MILDTSALLAILRAEPDAPAYADALAGAGGALLSAISYLAAAAVVDAAGDPVASRRFDELLRAAAITVVPVTVQQAMIARAAYRDFGAGSGHPAALSVVDCAAYALAKSTNDRLLHQGDGFAHTDLAR